MKSVSSLIRAAAFAAIAFGASAFVPATGTEAQAQGWSHGHRAYHHHRAAPRPVYRHRHYAPRRAYVRPVVRPYYAPRYRPYVAPVYVAPQRCVIKKRWVNTYYGPQLVRQRVCYRGW